MLTLFSRLKPFVINLADKKKLCSLLNHVSVYEQVYLNINQNFFTMDESCDEKCLFCGIVRERSSEFVYEDEDFVSFKDVKPATPHHYLIIPKKHIKNPSTLKSSDIDLVKRMLSIGEEILEKQNCSLEDARYGYHWPPFNSIEHLHMHAISPQSAMSIFGRIIFKPNSYWFVTAKSFIERLEKGEKK